MATKALRDYDFPSRDAVEGFHGNQMVFVGWDKHLMFCAPFGWPLPPSMPFGALLEAVLPPAFGAHPQFAQVDWAKAEWTKGGKPFKPDPAKSLADNGIGHKDVLRFRTPGLDGLYGAGF